MKKFLLPALLAAVCLMPALFLLACPDDSGKTGEVPPLFTNNGSTLKYNKNPTFDYDTGEITQHRVTHTVWYEPEEDPRQVIGYQLEDGTPFFDHIVFLYGMRIVYHNCATNPRDSSRCQKMGLHACYGENMWVYQDEWEEHFKPVRDRGIKISMSIVPAGGSSDQGMAVGTLYRWAGSNSWQTLMDDPNAVYIADEEATSRFIEQLREFQVQHQLDGYAFDEEYSGSIKHATGTTALTNLYNSTAAGQNILRFMHDMNLACYGPNYDKYDADQVRNSSDRTNRLIFQSYEISFGNNIASSYQLPDSHPDPTQRGKWIYRDDLLDMSYHAFYGNWAGTSSVFGSSNKSKYGPASIALADTASTAPKPPPGTSGGSGIIPRMQQHLQNNYGVVMYYCLRSRDEMAIGIEKWNKGPWPNIYGPDNRPETYLTQISEALHGQKTIYVGPDYSRRFEFQ